jgi:cytochrome c oxidase accessory protein FixG
MEAGVTNGDSLYVYDEEFRNTIATVDEKGKRIWIYAKKPSGPFYRRRIALSIGLLALLFAGPFIRIGGQPLMLLNFLERRFVLFGQAFWPQDFVIVAITLITFFVFIILFTVVFGRVWCGWMCPQTLFMEMVFRKIEYWLEGDANTQRRAAKQPLTASLAARKTLKHFLFLIISILIAHTVMAYIIGTDQVVTIVQQSPTDRIGGFISLAAFTGIFYAVFAFFREQACIAVCPYGRLQGVLLVKESIVVAYDWLRGEPRGKVKKHIASEVRKGDCVDCKLCVHVCPTGIDIRNGTQLECVNCTACIDACDDVMLKIGKPKGLIRFASHNSILNGVQKLFTVRVLAYSIVLISLLGVLGFTILTRTNVETTILKVSGTLYQRKDNDVITNLYNVQFVNKTFSDLPVELRIESPNAARLVKTDGKPAVVPAEGILKTIYFIEIPSSSIESTRTVVYVGVYENGELIENLKVKFIGPVTTKRQKP